VGVIAMVVAALPACTSSGEEAGTPGLAPRGTVLTTVKPSRQDLTNRLSLSGKVTLNPIFGLVAPVAGEVRYLDVRPTTGVPTKATRVAAVWSAGKATHIDVPAGATFSGRLVGDRTPVSVGTPIVSARYGSYGVVADIDGAQVYKVSGALSSVEAQITNGPGPFPCTVLGTIAALPAGSVPEPPAPTPTATQSGQPAGPPKGDTDPDSTGQNKSQPGSDATGVRLVCTAPADVKLINGASATLAVVTEKVANALVLPVEAVAGSQGKGKVDIVGADGARQTRDVVLGLTDGKVVEIRSGLSGDETVAVPGPNLPSAPADGNKDGSSEMPR
jgi:hypothetical protein